MYVSKQRMNLNTDGQWTGSDRPVSFWFKIAVNADSSLPAAARVSHCQRTVEVLSALRLQLDKNNFPNESLFSAEWSDMDRSLHLCLFSLKLCKSVLPPAVLVINHAVRAVRHLHCGEGVVWMIMTTLQVVQLLNYFCSFDFTSRPTFVFSCYRFDAYLCKWYILYFFDSIPQPYNILR